MDYVKLKEGEIGLVYEWNREEVIISLLQQEQGELKTIYGDSIKNPAFYYSNNIRKNRGSLLDDLKLQMCHKMMIDDESVERIGCVGLGPANTEAWDRFYNSAEGVLNCLLKGRDAKIILEDYFAAISDVYTQEDFAKLLKPFYEETKKLIEKMIEEQFKMSNKISKVFLSGEYATLNFVEVWMKEYMGDDVCIEKNIPKKDADGFVYLTTKGVW